MPLLCQNTADSCIFPDKALEKKPEHNSIDIYISLSIKSYVLKKTLFSEVFWEKTLKVIQQLHNQNAAHINMLKQPMKSKINIR